ncbi:MAG: TlpA family protein disulfide reductase [Myxococcales bacterium]|jgi:thiol-disulfide isomerase/thioredoxin|nr:TlpA family protein disulfide reductase [Myxococcales bacterium]
MAQSRTDSKGPAPADGDRPLYGVAVAFVFAAVLAGFALMPRLVAARQIGADAPDAEAAYVTNATGRFKLTEHRGKAVILDFWATWCGPCRAELPVVARVAARYRDAGLVVVGVNTSDEAGNAAAYARDAKLDFPIAFDEGNRIARAFHVENLPTLVIIGKDGKIVAVRTGITSDSELDRLAREAMR